MSIIKPPVLPPWADAGDKTQPSDLEIENGWPTSAVPPSRQRFNWILNFCANAVRYLCKKGIAAWDANETYDLHSRVMGTDGRIYRSKVASNLNNVVTDLTKWDPNGFNSKVVNHFVKTDNTSPMIDEFIDLTFTPTIGVPHSYPVRTVTVTEVPANSQLAMIRIWLNFNYNKNASRTLNIRKNASEPWTLKIAVDPVWSPTLGSHSEGESSITFPVFFDTSNNTFQYEVVMSDGQDDTLAAELTVRIWLEGFWVEERVLLA